MTSISSMVKRNAQDHFQDGLFIVVGCGLSMAEGIPGMGELAKHLKVEIPNKIATAPDPSWDLVVKYLDSGDHLESAMSKVNLNELTVRHIIAQTAELIRTKEREIISNVLIGKRTLPFTVFARHLFKSGKRFGLLTTNYDRLIETASELAGIGVDTRFFGNYIGHLDSKKSSDSHKEAYSSGKNQLLRQRACLSIFKPHGSLDWYELNGKVIQCQFGIEQQPVIITPGASKYQASFRTEFDDHRTASNRYAANATRLLFIGYGFNDDHLEHQICTNRTLTRPAIIISKVLTENAKTVIRNSSNVSVTAFCADESSDSRTKVITSKGEEIILDEKLWDLEGFNKGILQ